jgi:phosphatidylserine/phosphatidylglycerophosphate/cardiolipin synthase-like enzyme
VSLVLVALLLGTLTLQAGEIPIPGQAQLLENGAYGTALVNRIHGAKRRVICAFYLFRIGESAGNRPRAVAAELIAARRRGVEVTVILEGGKGVGAGNRATGNLLSQGGVRVLFPAAGVTTHAKAVSIDDRYVMIGSHNLTQSALKHNNELSLVLDSPQLAVQVRRYLEQL